MDTYKDTISGETLYIQKTTVGIFYYKGKNRTVYHRVDGPAKLFKNGEKVWFRNGELHRLDGPAIEYSNGHKTWCINNHVITSTGYLGYAGSRYLQEDLDDIKGK